MANLKSASAQIDPVRSRATIPARRRLWQLEAVRGFAAFYIVLHHLSSNYLKLKGTIWGFPFRFGAEAVLIFFILSGFVICYSHQGTAATGDDFKSYLIKRTRRIYPIYLLSMLFAFVILCIGAGGWVRPNFPQLFGNVFMLQNFPRHPGTFCLPFADNMPLWSLSFEWWFYMMFFPINRWVPRSAQKFVVLAICVVGLVTNQLYPNGVLRFLIFFIVWWVGVELAHEFRKTGDVSFSRQKIMLALIGLPLAWYGVVCWRWTRDGSHLIPHDYPLIDFRYFLMTLVFVGIIFVWRKIRFAGFDMTIGLFERVGAISFALYVFHYPILCDLRLLPGDRFFYLDLALRISLAFSLAWLAEGIFQKWINRITNPLLTRPKGQ